MFSAYFIDRPVLANVLALVMVLIGAVSLLNLPVSQYPNVVPPTVQVTTRYPGASARTRSRTGIVEITWEPSCRASRPCGSRVRTACRCFLR